MQRYALLALLLNVWSCSHGAPPPLLGSTQSHPIAEISKTNARDKRQVVVAQARVQLQAEGEYQVHGATFEADPVGFVRAAYWAAHIELFDRSIASQVQHEGMEILYLSAAAKGTLHHSQPRPGDLLFLDGDTRGSQLYPSGVAVVESVGTDGTINVIGSFAEGACRIALNLRTADKPDKDAPVPHNAVLEGGERAISARLFRSFADPF